MTTKQRKWGSWSEAKLSLLERYLSAFTTAVRGKSPEAIYLGLFAGDYNNQRRGQAGTFTGSSRIAFETEPQFTRMAMFELENQANKLKLDIVRNRPSEQRWWEIFAGDCNDTITNTLFKLEEYKWAPTFAFLDPDGLDLRWSTVEQLARWRTKEKTKVELLILFPEPALPRVIGQAVKSGKSDVKLVDKVYGTKDWLAIYQRYLDGHYNPKEIRAELVRAELVNLYRWRLERNLRYKKTHALEFHDNNKPLYTIIFATDSEVGDRIMYSVLDNTTRMIPRLRALSEKAKAMRSGKISLEGMDIDETEITDITSRYEHCEPWEPPQMKSTRPDITSVFKINPSIPFAWSED